MIVTIAENGCDDPDHHMETPIFFLMTVVMIRMAKIMEIVLSRRSWRLSDDQVTIENVMETTSAARSL